MCYADLTAAIPHSCLNGVQAVKDMNIKSETAACNLGSDHTHQGKPQLQQQGTHSYTRCTVHTKAHLQLTPK